MRSWDKKNEREIAGRIFKNITALWDLTPVHTIQTAEMQLIGATYCLKTFHHIQLPSRTHKHTSIRTHKQQNQRSLTAISLSLSCWASYLPQITADSPTDEYAQFRETSNSSLTTISRCFIDKNRASIRHISTFRAERIGLGSCGL